MMRLLRVKLAYSRKVFFPAKALIWTKSEEKSVQLVRPEVHLQQSNFLQNSYFSQKQRNTYYLLSLFTIGSNGAKIETTWY